MGKTHNNDNDRYLLEEVWAVGPCLLVSGRGEVRELLGTLDLEEEMVAALNLKEKGLEKMKNLEGL